MSAFSALEISKRALLVQKLGLDVTSNNIANVNTPGYSRRDPIARESSPHLSGNTFLGTGVLVDKLRTYREEFFDKEIRSTLARNAGFESDEKIISRLEAILGEPSDMGLTEITSKFFNSFEELSLKPDSIALRQNVLNSAQQLTERLNGLYNQFNDLREQALNDLNGIVGNANQLIDQIAKLNKNIGSTSGTPTPESQTYADERENLLEELSKFFNVTSTYNENGTNNVYINGINVVTGSIPSQLKLLVDINPVSSERTAKIVKVDDNNNILNTINPQSGEAQSLLKAYNILLDEKDSSTVDFSITRNLNEFTSNLVQKVNTITIGGFGLDDSGAVPPGRNFFEPAIGTITAGNIALSSDIAGKPRDIPMSDSPSEPGNNALSRQIAALATDSTFINGFNPTDYITSLIGTVGNLGYEASYGRNSTQLVSDQLMSHRESIIGVNLDEEAINLIKFQKAFEAASRVVNTTNEILTTLINLGR